uniref:CUB domain-containing protein n=1 Tax=Cyprinodon variegatus TaxID=28743 RepID=A0A3Q2CW47_CYPVA
MSRPLYVFLYPASEQCGGYLDASDAGYITTPGYPQEYPPHQNCHWVITAPEPSQRIVLNFNPHFEMEKLDSALGLTDRSMAAVHWRHPGPLTTISRQ